MGLAFCCPSHGLCLGTDSGSQMESRGKFRGMGAGKWGDHQGAGPGRRGCGGGPISSNMALAGPQSSWAAPDSPVETEGQMDKARKLLGQEPQGVVGK